MSSARRRVVNRVKARLKAKRLEGEKRVADLHLAQYAHGVIHHGETALRSYWSPGLVGETYTIAVEQTVTVNRYIGSNQQPTVEAERTYRHTHDFVVVGPKWTLPADSVLQTYPPQGHEDEFHVLPHVILKDPQLPWETAPSQKEKELWEGLIRDRTKPAKVGVDDNDLHTTNGRLTDSGPRVRTPWIALLTFTDDELRLTEDQLSTSGFFPPAATLPKVQDSTTFSVNMSLDEVSGFDRSKVLSPVKADQLDADEKALRVDVIFPSEETFKALFASHDSTTGRRYIPDGGRVDLSRFAYVSHVREVNTTAMSDVNQDEIGPELARVGVIVSSRTGMAAGLRTPQPTPVGSMPPIMPPIAIPPTGEEPEPDPEPLPDPSPEPRTLPAPVHVHLVSLVGLDSDRMALAPEPTDRRVALISLLSWSYIATPGNPKLPEHLAKLGNQVPNATWLRPPQIISDKLRTDGSHATQNEQNKRLRDRMTDGFTLLNHHVPSGETTAAFYRGPLVPTLPSHPVAEHWPTQVASSSGYHIMDQKLGIMDITYSTAWELGRTLAVADRAFTAALLRLRERTHVKARSRTLARQSPHFRTKTAIMKDLDATLTRLHTLPADLKDHPATIDATRLWTSPAAEPTPHKRPNRDPDLRESFIANMHHAIATAASSATVEGVRRKAQADSTLYNELNAPADSDWALVMKWIMDRLYLDNIPGHYLLPEITHVPAESIRFFYIDPNWLDALVDGALSVGNHLESEDDPFRSLVKLHMNAYLKADIDTDHPYPPQVPTFGFIIRSSVIQLVPNLQVRCPRPPIPDPDDASKTNPDPRPDFLRTERIGPDVLLCLMDRLPGKFQGDLDGVISLSQPSHQQRFSAGQIEDDGTITVTFTRASTKEDSGRNPLPETLGHAVWRNNSGLIPPVQHDPPYPFAIYDFETGAIAPPAFAQACTNFMIDKNPPGYEDPVPNSALLGMQLNDHMWRLQITVPHADLGSKRPDYDDKGHPVPRAFPVPPKIDNLVKRDQSDEEFPTPTTDTQIEKATPMMPLQNIAVQTASAAQSISSLVTDHLILEQAMAFSSDTSEAVAEGLMGPIPLRYNYNVCLLGQPVRAGVPHGTIVILNPTTTTVRRDLLVNITPRDDVNQGGNGEQIFLKYVMLVIPYLRPVPAGEDAATLAGGMFTDSQNLGVEMISNYAFNVVTSNTGDGNYKITILPRTANNRIDNARIKSLAFLLKGVTMQGESSFKMRVEEYYVDPNGTAYNSPTKYLEVRIINKPSIDQAPKVDVPENESPKSEVSIAAL